MNDSATLSPRGVRAAELRSSGDAIVSTSIDPLMEPNPVNVFPPDDVIETGVGQRQPGATGIYKWVAFAGTLVLMLCGGTLYLFGTYSSELKSTLAYSQTQVNIVASAGGFGLYLSSPLIGSAVDKLDPRRVVVAAALLLFAGYSGMSLVLSGVLPTHVSFVALCYACVGLGSSCCYNSALKTNIINFEPNFHGFAVGVSVSMFGLSAFVFSAISRWFVVALQSQPDVHKLGPVATMQTAGQLDAVRFLMFMGVCTGIMTLIAGFTLGKSCGTNNAPPGPQYQPLPPHRLGSSASLNNGSSTSIVSGEPDPDAQGIGRRNSDSAYSNHAAVSSGCSVRSIEMATRNFFLSIFTNPILRDASAWSLFVPFLMLSGLGLMYINNIGSIVLALFPQNHSVQSSHANNIQPLMVSLISLFNCLGRIVTGLVSDRAQTRRNTPRIVFLIFGGCIILVAQTMGVFMTPSLVMLAVCTSLLGFGYGSVFSSTPAIVGNWFGVQRFGSNWGFFQVGPALGGYIWNLAFGLWMDSQHTGAPDQGCTGSICFRGAFVLGLVAACFSVVLLIRLHLSRLNQQRYMLVT